MGLTVRHTFTSAKPDSSDITIIQPSHWNATHQVVDNSTIYVSKDYDFAAQTPGGSLAIGSNTITLAPVPDGVNGSDTNHYLYISNGAGTAEAVKITGGTAVSGAASGTIIVTCANTHSGAWTIRSATSGIQEAFQLVKTAGYGKIFVPAGVHTNYTTVLLPNSVPFTLQGAGWNATKITLGNSVNADVISNENFSTLTSSNSAPAGMYRGTLSDFTVDGNKTNQSAGWGIRVYAHGSIFSNLCIQNSKSGGFYTEYAYDPAFTNINCDLENRYLNLTIFFNDNTGWVNRGPHDSYASHITCLQNGTWGLDCQVSAGVYNGGSLFINGMDTYLNTTGGIRTEGAIQGIDIVGSCATGYGMYVANNAQSCNIVGNFGGGDGFPALYVTGNDHHFSGLISNAYSSAGSCCIKIAGSQSSVYKFMVTGSADVISITSDGGHNCVDATCYVDATKALINGTPAVTSTYRIVNVLASTPQYIHREPNVDAWRKYTITKTGGNFILTGGVGVTTSVAAAVATTQTLSLDTVSFPFVSGLLMKTSAAATGVSTAVANFGNTGSTTLYYSANYDLKAAVAASNISGAMASTGTSSFGVVVLAMTITTTGGNVSAIADGFAMDIWVKLANLL